MSGRLGAWLRVVADHLAVDVLRRRAPASPVEFDERLYSRADEDERLASLLDRDAAATDIREALKTAVDEDDHDVARVVSTWLGLASANGEAPSDQAGRRAPRHQPHDSPPGAEVVRTAAAALVGCSNHLDTNVRGIDMSQDHLSPVAGTPHVPSSRATPSDAGHPQYDFDDPILGLLEDDVMGRLRDALRNRGLDKYAEMLPDTVAALTLLALLPAEYRGGALALLGEAAARAAGGLRALCNLMTAREPGGR